MGFFNKDATSSSSLTPLTVQRVAAVLEADGAHFQQGDENQLGGYWDGHLFLFTVTGRDQEFLVISGEWNRTVAPDQFEAILRLVNQWNTEKFWPKAFVRLVDAEDGTQALEVHAEVAVDYEHGVTDEQINQHIACAIGTSGSLFDHLDEYYPEQAAAARAELERIRAESDTE